MCNQVFFNLFIPEQCNESIKGKAQLKIIKLMQEMGIMDLGYYDVTRESEWILAELTCKLNSIIKKRLDRLNILGVQECCIRIADVLSAFSFAIFEPDTISKNSKSLIDGINILSQIFGEKPEGMELQEKIGILKEALNLLYFETESNIENNNCQNKTIEGFMDLLELETSTILVYELKKSLRISKNCVIHFEENPLHIYSEQLEDVNKVLQKMLTVKESLYDETANEVMSLFREEKGFNDKSLFLLCNEFESNETVSLSLKDMKALIKEKLCLNEKQLDFFVSIMFLNYKDKTHDEIIRNVNCGFFTTPFAMDVEGKVWLNKSNLYEAAKYLRRRVINEDIPLSKNIKNVIKEKINEKKLPIIKKELQIKGIKCFTNVDLAKDKVLKKLFYGIKNTPHEIDLYYVSNNVLKIYDLKNYLIPLSVKESVIRIGNSIAKEATKLHNLNNILENNHKLIEERLNLHFNSIEYAILLTTDCYYADKNKDISVIFVDDFLRMLRKKFDTKNESEKLT